MISLEQFELQWLEEIESGDPSTTHLGHRFAEKILRDWHEIDATTVQLHAQLGIHCSQSAVGMALGRLNLTFKKRQSMRPSRIAPTSPSIAASGSRTSH